ncbi:hypothetical protein ETU08_02650 [Apibacter muscae]|uniref:Calcineurin-like phosphoesterase domain-containing protein n=1 Tax=Apibacter muscae TaxID=2509004 RepID=A0A563DIZ0_9FLAO|nr:metallophosphoesterase [Apibacter muscae]TWP24720.1 hypothetical protein ETU10_01810 [Apibacter muscae]TWP29774.1 hypothetical protein ETU09_02000 [Apibacter muscae]TWP30922.1 hypothetical protein ETU08_02650 [Apibacter muscae]
MQIEVREEKINLFSKIDNVSILHLSDFHIKLSSKMLEEIKKIILDKSPDVIALTGDYYDLPQGATLFRLFILELSTLFPIVFIHGNHDTWYGKKIFNSLINIPNCFYLKDYIFTFTTKNGSRINFTSWENRKNLSSTESDKNILLIHNPEKIRVDELINIHVILAGHLHGGQIILFKTINNTFFPGNLLYKYCLDRKEIKNTCILVSKGLGDLLPLRYNCPKEILYIRIE